MPCANGRRPWRRACFRSVQAKKIGRPWAANVFAWGDLPTRLYQLGVAGADAGGGGGGAIQTAGSAPDGQGRQGQGDDEGHQAAALGMGGRLGHRRAVSAGSSVPAGDAWALTRLSFFDAGRRRSMAPIVHSDQGQDQGKGALVQARRGCRIDRFAHQVHEGAAEGDVRRCSAMMASRYHLEQQQGQQLASTDEGAQGIAWPRPSPAALSR